MLEEPKLIQLKMQVVFLNASSISKKAVELVEATIQGLCKHFNIAYKPVNSDTRQYDNCIVYSDETCKTIAQVLSWSLKNYITKQ